MTIAVAIYLIYLIIFGILSAAVFYHARRFSYQGDATRAVLIIYVTISVAIIFGTIMLGFSR